jgi:hypothetical protein
MDIQFRSPGPGGGVPGDACFAHTRQTDKPTGDWLKT